MGRTGRPWRSRDGWRGKSTTSWPERTPQQGPGRKVNGKLQWMHRVSCAQLTRYDHHPQRGFAALEAMNVLPQFKGALVYAAWSAYF